MRVPQRESTSEPLTEQEAENVIAMLALRPRRIASLPEPRPRAWDRAAFAGQSVTGDELRDSYRTLKEAHRRHDPDLDYWRDAFHGKLERFLNQ